MKKFHSGKDLKSYFMTNDEMEGHLKTHVAFFKKMSKKSGKNIKYYAKFQTCQLLNIVMLILNFWATNKFLTGGFSWYGSEAVKYLTAEAPVEPGPMCETFPTVVRINILCKTLPERTYNSHYGNRVPAMFIS